MPHGGYHGPKKPTTGTTKPGTTGGYVHSNTGTTTGHGHYSPGYIPPKVRRETSGFDPNQYPGGVLTETTPTGHTTTTYNVLPVDGKDKSRTVVTQPKPDDTTDDTTTGDGTDTEDKSYDDYEYYLLPNGKLDIRKVKRNLWFFEQKTGKKIANITADGTIIFHDQTEGKGTLKLASLLKGGLDYATGFKPEEALTKGGMGDQGKAALFHKLNSMDPEQFREFLNRKGNLDRIREFSGDMSPTAMADFEAKLKAAASEGGEGGQFFADMIASTAGEDFEMLKLKNSPDKEDRRKYYQLNPHLLATSGGLEEAARAGISYIPGYGPVDMPEGHSGQFQQQAGGGGIGNIPPPTTTDPNIPTPDYYLRRQYMPQNVTGFTPNYLGGPEQMHIAGGWWDPVAKKWIGSPWGTQNQYQFNQGGIVGTNPLLFKNQGGMASDNGIKSFKKYGY